MMMLMFCLIMSLFFCKSNLYLIILFVMVSALWPTVFPLYNSFIFDCSYYLLDVWSWSLIMLTCISWFSMILASNMTQLTDYSYLNLKNLLTVILSISFLVKSVFWFYCLFELSLIPIFCMIMGWGYQPERLSASLYLILYTVTASLPLLLLSLSWKVYFKDCMLLWNSEVHFFEMNAWVVLISLSAIAAFLVKFPMYLTHLWLPKAHVEAPVAGSMILAAVLLKLGGYGIFRVFVLLDTMNDLVTYLKYFSLLGGAMVALLCVTQNDMKVLIAYSSVSHMALAIAGCLSGKSSALFGVLLMLIAHGLASAGMFAGANMIYLRAHSRNLLFTKSLLVYSPMFSFLWFLVCLANMGGPPSLNLMSEVILFISLISDELLFSIPLMVAAFLAVVYTLILYASTQQGQVPTNSSMLFILNSREMLVLSYLVLLTNFLVFSFSLIK